VLVVSDYYAQKIAKKAVTVDNTTLGELITDAVEDSDADLGWGKQGEIHEAIEERIEDAAREAAADELQVALE